MDPQPPEKPSANLEEKVAELQADLIEIKRLLQKLARDIDDKFALTKQPSHSYYSQLGLDNQEQIIRESSHIRSSDPKKAGKPNQVPYVEEGQQANCTRCGHIWVPFVRRPKQCPACHQNWYKPKAWTRSKNLSAAAPR